MRCVMKVAAGARVAPMRVSCLPPVALSRLVPAAAPLAGLLFALALLLAALLFALVLAALLFALVLAAPPARAQAAPPSPAGLTQSEVDALVDRISTEVVRRLKAEAAPPIAAPAAPAQPAAPPPAAPAAGPAPTAAPMAMDMDGGMNQSYLHSFQRAGRIVMAFPELGAQLARVPGILGAMAGERPLGPYALLLLLAGVLVVAADKLVGLVAGPLRHRLAARMQGWPGVGALALLALLDALGLLAAWFASYTLLSTWFPGMSPQSQLAALLLFRVYSWLLYMFAFRLVLRPALAPARLAAIDDADARGIYRAVGVVVAVVLASGAFVHVVASISAPPDVIALTEILDALVVAGTLVAASVCQRRPVGRLFLSLSRREEPHPVMAAASQHWIALAIPFFLVLGAARIHGAIMERATVPSALVTTINVVIGLVLLEAVISKVARLLRRPGSVPGEGAPSVSDAVARCLRFAVFMAAALFLAEVWILDVLALAHMMDVGHVTASVLAVGATALVSYCVFEAIRYFTDRYAARARKPAVPGQSDDAIAADVSRVGTLVPLLRVVLYATLGILVTLTVLSQIGVNVTALIAGASVIGLAISFGSQTLVKDIVSGVFYLVDDAFRVGEYIDCGKAKGVVEGFTMRSLRLRHQSGQIHTIPFGQLGQITNFSRDWTTMKLAQFALAMHDPIW